MLALLRRAFEFLGVLSARVRSERRVRVTADGKRENKTEEEYK